MEAETTTEPQAQATAVTEPAVPVAPEAEPTPARVLAGEITSLVSKDDIEVTLQIQKEIKDKMGQTISAITEFNEHSEKELSNIGAQLEEYTKMNKEMKKDLEDIFKRLRVLKVELMKKYPSEFRQANAELIEQFGELEEDD